MPGAKKGGVLNVHTRPAYYTAFDTYDVTGRSGTAVNSPLLNNLIWTDPYGDGKTLTGEIAKDWAFSGDGKVLTFNLNRGIKFHDGKALASKDVAYNIDRGWKPRSPRMTQFAGKLNVITSIETPDDNTVRLTLSRPSNFLLQAFSIVEFLIYPSSFPMPETTDQWGQTRIGSGPFKLKQFRGDTFEVVKNDAYWKPGLPHLDGLVFNGINDTSLAVAALRTGRIDAVTYGNTFEIQPFIDDGTLQKAQGFVPHKMTVNGGTLKMINKEPWTNPKLREAVDLAINRQDLVKLGYTPGATPSSSPMLPSELGGNWGISLKVTDQRPGVRANKTEDIAKAKQILKDAGIDPSKIRTRILTAPTLVNGGQVIEANLREIGLATQLMPVEPAQQVDAVKNAAWEMIAEGLLPSVDDPLDALGVAVQTNGGQNKGGWSDPDLDKLFTEQDQTLDVAKRRQIINTIQDRVLQNRWTLILFWGTADFGGNGYVKNIPPKLPFLFSPWYRWEQVWLDRG